MRGETKILEKETRCKCPRCKKYHKRRMYFTGTGTPWKFCGPCAVFAKVFDGPDQAVYHRPRYSIE